MGVYKYNWGGGGLRLPYVYVGGGPWKKGWEPLPYSIESLKLTDILHIFIS